MRSTAAREMIFGAGRPGTEAVVTTASAAAMRASSTSCCLRLLLRGELARVAAAALGAHAGLDELGAEGLHLLARGAAHVVGLDHRAQAPRGGDGLQSGDACADDQHLRRADGARRRW